MNEPTTLTTEERPNGVKVIHIHGDLDSMGTHMVEKSFESALDGPTQRVVVDMQDVSFISSAGMAMLLVKGKNLRQQRGQLVLASASERVREVLALAGFNELFDMYPTVDDAVNALAPAES